MRLVNEQEKEYEVSINEKTDTFKNSINMHSKLINMIPQAIMVLEHTKILFINKYALELFEIDNPNECLGKNFLNYFCFEESEKLKEISLDFSFAANLKKESAFKIITKKGNIIEVGAKFSSTDNDEMIFIVFEDRTELSRLKEEKKKSDKTVEMAMEWNKRLIDIIPEAIFVHDGKNIIFANSASKRLLKAKDIYEIIGKSIFEIVHPDYHEIEKNRCEVLINKKDYLPIVEEKLILMDGRIVEVEVVGASINMKGNRVVIDAVRDVTYRKKNEKLKSKIEIKQKRLKEAEENERLINEFLSNISHEFKTPLNLILTTQQLLNLLMKKDIESNPSLKSYMNILKKNSYRLLRLIDNLINITEFDLECYNLSFKNYDISYVLEEIIEPVKNYLGGADIKFSYKNHINNFEIYCDKNEIQRAVLNIISNSIKFTEPGGNIEVVLDKTEKNVRISVKDSGCGIDKNKIEVIFNALRQEDKSLTRANEGSGLGLAIVERIVKIHGGKIKVESEKGKGSRFTVYLPIKKAVKKNYSLSRVDNYYNVSPKEKVNIEFSDIML